MPVWLEVLLSLTLIIGLPVTFFGFLIYNYNKEVDRINAAGGITTTTIYYRDGSVKTETSIGGL